MPTVINGVPAHVLLIHVVVVLIPLGALFTVLSAVWPTARYRLGIFGPITCLIGLASVPLTTNAGEWLQDKIDAQRGNALIQQHADLGNGFLLFALALFLVSAAVWWLGRKYGLSLRPAPTRDDDVASAGGTRGRTATALRERSATKAATLPVWASVLTAVVAVAVSAVTVWQLYRVGDSGAQAVWRSTVK